MMAAQQLIMASAVDLGVFDSAIYDGTIFLQHDLSNTIVVAFFLRGKNAI